MGIRSDDTAADVRATDGKRVLHTFPAPAGRTIADVFLDLPYLVVVTRKSDDSGNDEALVVDTDTWTERPLPATAPRPAQGPWAAGAGRLAYGSERGGDHCLAEIELKTLRGALGECVGPRHGVNQVDLSGYGTGYATFDDHRPASCGSARVRLRRSAPKAIEAQKKCAPWEATAVTADAVVWSEVPRMNEIEITRFYARVRTGPVQDLGEGTTGSLVWCAEAAFYIDQATSRLYMWTPGSGHELAFQGPANEGESVSVIGAPTCSGGIVSFPLSTYDPDKRELEEFIYWANLY